MSSGFRVPGSERGSAFGRSVFPRLLLIAVLGVVAAGIAAACGDDDDDGGGKLTTVTLMLNWTPNTHHAGIYVARAQGWYREAGLDVKIVEPASGGVNQVVGAGKADFGIAEQEVIIPARQAGVPVVALAALVQHNDSSLMALSSEGISRPRDLAGKVYGGFGGPLESALIKKLVSCDGGDAEKVKFVEVGNVDYLAGLEQNRFDFVWVFDGWDALRAKEVEKKGITTLPFINYLTCIPDWYTPELITNESTLKNRPEVVRKFMAATARGYNFAIEKPDEAAEMFLKQVPEADKALIGASFRYYATRFVDKGRPWGQQDLAVWIAFERFLREAKLTEKDVDVKSAFTNDFLPR